MHDHIAQNAKTFRRQPKGFWMQVVAQKELRLSSAAKRIVALTLQCLREAE
jgi:hypothetical protein